MLNFFIALLLLGLGIHQSIAASIIVTDFRGKQLSFNKPVERIVCLIESVLTGLYMLGAEDKVVGVSTSVYRESVAPQYAAMDPRIKEKEIPAPGNWDFVNIESVISLMPDIVIIWSQQKEAIQSMEEKGIPVYGVWLDSFDDVYKEVCDLGALTGKETRAAQIIQYTQNEIKKFQRVINENKPKIVKVYYMGMPYQQGKIQLMGQDIKKCSLSQRAKLIGFLAQKHRPVFPFSVEDVVLTGRASYINLTPGKKDQEHTLSALESVGIIHLKDRAYTELSGGEQQLVMIARVLAQTPKVILLDEPTTHLDFCNQARVLKLLKDLVKKGMTIVAVLHDPNIAFLYGDAFVFLKDRRIVRPEDGINPWDSAFLKSIYQSNLQSVPYLDRALIVPEIY